MTGASELVWLASYPKSGNTWLRILLANLAAGEDAPADINDLSSYGAHAADRDQFEASTLLDSSLLSHEEIDALRPRVYEAIARRSGERQWMKVHDAYRLLPGGEPLLGESARAALYLVRDPRDVAVSFAHHDDVPVDTAIAMMETTDYGFCRSRAGLPSQLRQTLRGWSDHVASWLDQHCVPVHVIRYEDLAADAAAAFGAALTFVGYHAAASDIERSIRRSAFRELQRLERIEGFAERESRGSPFFRAGEAGGWRSILTAEQRARIERSHGAMMDRLGYARG